MMDNNRFTDIDSIVAVALESYRTWDSDGRPVASDEEFSLSREQVARLIDHTQLKPAAGRESIAQLCAEAKEYSFATVCVHSSWAATCIELLRDSSVDVCVVAGFPQGTNLTSVKRFEALESMNIGASEIDMVIQIGRLKDKDYAYVAQDIAEVADACHDKDATLKTIIETCLLTDEEKVAACAIAKAAGADFVKTSTGFNGAGANQRDVALMRHTVGASLGVKAAGGVHNYDELIGMVKAGATRIGASAGVAIVESM